MTTPVERNKQRLLDYLACHPCVDCGETDIRVLTFDHKNPKKKKATVSTLVHKGYSWDVVESEINKCVVRCLNDHMRREDERSNSRRQQYYEGKS